MRRRLTAAATIAALALAGLTGCGGSGQWCEHDATDRKVSNRYCEENTPGYEWESSDSHRRKTTKTKTRTGAPAKTTGPRTTSGSRTSRSGTSSGSRSSSSKSSSSRSSSSRSSGSRR